MPVGREAAAALRDVFGGRCHAFAEAASAGAACRRIHAGPRNYLTYAGIKDCHSLANGYLSHGTLPHIGIASCTLIRFRS